MPVQEIIKAYKALYPEELVERYRQGERNFEGINLLRAELEYILNSRSNEGKLLPFPPGLDVVNPLWADHYAYPFASEFQWESHGIFMPEEYDDRLSARDLAGVDLTGINLAEAYLYPVNLSGANLSRANLRRVKFFDANLSGANLSYADLRRSLLDDANLYDAILYMARLDRAVIRSTDMRGVDLRRAKLKKAILTGSNLRGCDLRKAYFDRT